MYKRLILVGVAVALTSLFAFGMSAAQATPATAPVSGPAAEIKQTIDKIVEQLRGADSMAQWRENVTGLVRGKFNFEIMSQGVLGPYWHRITPRERERFTELFSLLLEETYIGRVSEYSDEEVRFGAENIRKNRAMVDTFIEMENGQELPISYKLIFLDNTWQVYDVVIEEVSLVRNYRSNYAGVLRHKDMQELLEEMQLKINELRARRSEEGGRA